MQPHGLRRTGPGGVEVARQQPGLALEGHGEGGRRRRPDRLRAHQQLVGHTDHVQGAGGAVQQVLGDADVGVEAIPARSAACSRSSTRRRHAGPAPGERHRPTPAGVQVGQDVGHRVGRGRRAGLGRRGRLGAHAGVPDLDHLADEAESPPVDRADQSLVAAVVADRPAGRLDAARQRRLGHEAIAPDLVEQLGPGHDSVTVAHEVRQHVHHVRLDRHRSPVPHEVHGVRVQCHVCELHPHRSQLPAPAGHGAVLQMRSTPPPRLGRPGAEDRW